MENLMYILSCLFVVAIIIYLAVEQKKSKNNVYDSKPAWKKKTEAFSNMETVLALFFLVNKGEDISNVIADLDKMSMNVLYNPVLGEDYDKR